MNINLHNPPIESISPSYWAPGQDYTVIFTDPNGQFVDYGPDDPNNTRLYVFNPSQYTPGTLIYLEDPYVTHSWPTYLSSTQVSFSVSVGAGAPTEEDGLSFGCVGTGFVGGPGFIHITPCAAAVTPTLTPGSVQPGTWTAGVATNITITGTGFIPTDNPNYCVPSSLSITAGTEYVAITNLTVVSPTQITATVKPQITDPAETATVTVSNYQYNNSIVPLTASTTAQITPTPCTVPHVASVSPNVWLSGNTYRNVTFTGTNFITPSKATATCPTTTISVDTDEGFVTVSGVNVSSSTKITGTVRVPSGIPTEAATVVAYGDTRPTPDADVLGQPSIKWTSDPHGADSVIAGPDTNEYDLSVVVGQQIALTTTPTAATLAALPVPLTFAATTPTTWTVTGGTNIGGYTVIPPTGTPPTSSARVDPMILNTSSLTFYAVSSPASSTVTYTYCVFGQTTCPKSNATFEVAGPVSAAFTVTFGPLPPIVYDPTSKFYPGMGVGSPGLRGIIFQASDDPSSPNGTFSFVQLVNDQLTTRTDSIQGTCSESTGTGLDTTYPYGNLTTTANLATTGDSLLAGFNITDEEITSTASLTMYAMWTPSVSPSSPTPVPVPIGSVSWGWYTDAVQTSSGEPATWGWNPNSQVQDPMSQADQPVLGSTYPEWNTYAFTGNHPCIY